MTVTESPYKSNFFKMTSFQLIFPIFGWFIVSIVKISYRVNPILNISDADFIDLICYGISIIWLIFLVVKGMPTYYELFYFGVYEKQSTVTDKSAKTHKIASFIIAGVYLIQMVVLSGVQTNYENIIHIIFNFLPLILLTVSAAVLMAPQKQRADATLFTGSNYSFTWIVVLFQITLIIQSLAYAIKFTTYNTCTDCYLGISYMVSALLLIYYVVYGFQIFTIKHSWLPKYFYEEQVLFFTATAAPAQSQPAINTVQGEQIVPDEQTLILPSQG